MNSGFRQLSTTTLSFLAAFAEAFTAAFFVAAFFLATAYLSVVAKEGRVRVVADPLTKASVPWAANSTATKAIIIEEQQLSLIIFLPFFFGKSEKTSWIDQGDG
jgi:hypothetical protein